VPATKPSVNNNNNRSALLDEIRRGAQLNHVDPMEQSAQRQTGNGITGGSTDVRGQLLDQIRRGVDLKKVEPNTNRSETKSANEIGKGGALADALARALQERAQGWNQTSDSSDDDSNNSDDDDEWDDRST
ncbi:hypothetical protein BLA29_011799, partial [Euroglyphus maynei]